MTCKKDTCSRLHLSQETRKGKGYEEEKREVLVGFWRSIDGEGEGGSHGELKTQQEDQSQEGKENKECRSCTCVEDQGGYGKQKL